MHLPSQVSGIRFSFDPSQPPGRRIVPGSAHTTGPLGAHGAPRPLDPQRKYRVATKEYLAQGKDGYDVFAVGYCRVAAQHGSTHTNAKPCRC